MHATVLHVLPILAAEKSKTAFYIAGGALALWAVVISVGFGLRRPDFPHSVGGQRVVIGISAVLVVAAMSTAVLTSGVPVAQGGVSGVTGSESAKTTASSATAVGAAPGAKATASVLSLAADPSGQIKFVQSELKAPAGKVTIVFTNKSTIPHNVAVEGPGGNVIGKTPVGTGTSKLSLALRPGTYKYVCQVHPTMTGSLVVS